MQMWKGLEVGLYSDVCHSLIICLNLFRRHFWHQAIPVSHLFFQYRVSALRLPICPRHLLTKRLRNIRGCSPGRTAWLFISAIRCQHTETGTWTVNVVRILFISLFFRPYLGYPGSFCHNFSSAIQWTLTRGFYRNDSQNSWRRCDYLQIKIGAAAEWSFSTGKTEWTRETGQRSPEAVTSSEACCSRERWRGQVGDHHPICPAILHLRLWSYDLRLLC